ADESGSRLCGCRGRGIIRIEGWRTELDGAGGLAWARERPTMAAGCGGNVSPFDPPRSEKSATDFHCDLGGGRVSHRRWRQELEADQSRFAFAIHSRSERGSRP